MAQPSRLDLYADRRMVFRQFLTFLGESFTGATFSMQVRTSPDVSGTALITLATVTTDADGIRLMYAGTATVASHILSGYLTADIYRQINPATGNNYAPTDSVTLSQLRIIIGQPAMSPPSTGLIPLPQEVGVDQILAYDLLITPVGGIAEKRLYGDFVIRGTVTH